MQLLDAPNAVVWFPSMHKYLKYLFGCGLRIIQEGCKEGTLVFESSYRLSYKAPAVGALAPTEFKQSVVLLSRSLMLLLALLVSHRSVDQ